MPNTEQCFAEEPGVSVKTGGKYYYRSIGPERVPDMQAPCRLQEARRVGSPNGNEQCRRCFLNAQWGALNR